MACPSLKTKQMELRIPESVSDKIEALKCLQSTLEEIAKIREKVCNDALNELTAKMGVSSLPQIPEDPIPEEKIDMVIDRVSEKHIKLNISASPFVLNFLQEVMEKDRGCIKLCLSINYGGNPDKLDGTEIEYSSIPPYLYTMHTAKIAFKAKVEDE